MEGLLMELPERLLNNDRLKTVLKGLQHNENHDNNFWRKQ